MGQLVITPVRKGDPLRWGIFVTQDRIECTEMDAAKRRTFTVTERPTRVLVASREVAPGERLTEEFLEPRPIPVAYSSLDYGPADRAEELYGLTLMEPMAPGDPLRLTALEELDYYDECPIYEKTCPAIVFEQRGPPADLGDAACPEGTEAVSGIPLKTLESCASPWGWVFWCKAGEGHAEGPYRTWNLGGTPREEGRLCTGRRCGEWRSWTPEGQPSLRVRFVDGVPEGEANLGAVGQGTYTKGTRTGTWVMKVAEETIESTWSEGVAEGPWRVKDGQGRVHLEGGFTAGRPAGEWKALDDSGRVVGRWRLGDEGGPVVLEGPELEMKPVMTAARPIEAHGAITPEDLSSVPVPALVARAFAGPHSAAHFQGKSLEVHVPAGGFIRWSDLPPSLGALPVSEAKEGDAKGPTGASEPSTE
jgi:hypothetical protein